MKLKLNKLISAVLALALAFALSVPCVYAEGEETPKVTVTYIVQADETYGSPDALNAAGNISVAVGEDFILAEPLETDSILGTDGSTGQIYTGEWVFTGWSVPAYVYTETIQSDPDLIYTEEYTAIMEETEKKTLCRTSFDVEITGKWEFVPGEKLNVPDKIEISSTLPLAGGYDALSTFWPERETELEKVHATGLFPESIIRYMNENISQLPLQSSSFASVELSSEERATFLEAVKEAYSSMISDSEESSEIKAGIDGILLEENSENAGIETAFVVWCAEKAGLLEGKSRALVRTADINVLYSFLKNEVYADFITADELLQIYYAEDGKISSNINYNDSSVDFAHGDDWYDTENKKNKVLPGDLVVFKDELENPVTVGIIDSVEGRSITYVLCVSNGTPAEYTLNESDLERISATGAKAEIIGLRSCDPSRIVYEFLTGEMELPESAALGVMGNLYYESKFSTTVLGDYNTSFGLCQWHNDRFLNLVIFCMKNNYNIASLEGQLKFLEYELTEKYPGLLAELRQCGMTQAWAKQAAYRFCQLFEQPANLELNATLRGEMAAGAIWESFSELFLSTAVLENMKLAQTEQVAQVQSEYIFYTVKDGDTLAGICRNLGFDFNNHRREVININNITDENRLYIGQILIFPRTMIKSGQ